MMTVAMAAAPGLSSDMGKIGDETGDRRSDGRLCHVSREGESVNQIKSIITFPGEALGSGVVWLSTRQIGQCGWILMLLV